MEKNKESLQNTVQFLMYSYFGDWKDDSLYAAISRAYRDATMRAAFSCPDSKMKDILMLCGSEIIHEEILSYIGGGFEKRPYTDKNTKAKKILEDEELQKKINEEIDKINKDGDKDGYTFWHEKLCTKLVVLYSSKMKSSFSYGNAQKWVNMTMKYLYLMSPLLEGEDGITWPEKIKEKSNLFHIPIDSYILRGLFFNPKGDDSFSKRINVKYKEKYKVNTDFNLIKNEDLNYTNKEGKLKFNGNELILNEVWRSYRGIKGPVTWSNIEKYDEYLAVQNKVKSQIPEAFKNMPLAWENKVWIYAAQIING